MAELAQLFLHDLHHRHGARFGAFAGYDMPVQYAPGVMAEHLHTRRAAGLFDVSHMGQVMLRPLADMAALVAGFEALVPVDVAGLALGRQRYAMFTDPAGGILDDLMIANRGDHLFVVVNAGGKHADTAHMTVALSGLAEVTLLTTRVLLALQGPEAEGVLARLIPEVAALRFMDVTVAGWQGAEIWISRSGYTGEDGFEISVPNDAAEAFAEALLAEPGVALIGLGARDSLRLEAGMPLYGHDIDTTTTPAEAGLGWAIQKVRRTGGARAGGFPGAARILSDIADGPARRRVGLRPEGRAPMREGTLIFATADAAEHIGAITSGSFGPSVGAPIAMGYIPSTIPDGATVYGEVRGKRLPATVSPLPFRPATYKR